MHPGANAVIYRDNPRRAEKSIQKGAGSCRRRSVAHSKNRWSSRTWRSSRRAPARWRSISRPAPSATATSLMPTAAGAAGCRPSTAMRQPAWSARSGEGVTSLGPGDPSSSRLIRSCGHCGSCVQGEPVTCETDLRARPSQPAAAAERRGAGAGAAHRRLRRSRSSSIRPRSCASRAKSRSTSASLLACGVITGFGAVINTAGLRPGATAAVIGAGGVGLNAIQGAAISGARTVIALDLVESRSWKRPGASARRTASMPRRPMPPSEVRRLTGGRGADYVFVTVGAKAAFTAGLHLVARSGTIVLVGMPASGMTVAVDPGDIAHQQSARARLEDGRRPYPGRYSQARHRCISRAA